MIAAPSNPGLLQAMRDATESGDPRARQGIYETFRTCILVVPVRDGREGEREVWAARGDDGRTVLPAFTEADALAALASGPVQWAAIRGPDLASFAMQRRLGAVALNPSGPFGGLLDFREIDALADSDALRLGGVDPSSGAVRLEVRERSAIELRRPQAQPEALVAALRRELTGREEVESAYLVEATGPGRPHLTVCVALAAAADPSGVVKAVARAARTHAPLDEPIDVLPLSDVLANSLAETMDPLW